MYCSSSLNDVSEYRAKALALAAGLASADGVGPRLEQKTDGSTLYVDVRYVSLYHHEYQKVPVSRVRAAHAILQKAFSASNDDELAKVPQTALYPWKTRVGNPNIQFLPLDPNLVHVEYKQISTSSLTGAQPVTQAAQLGGVVSGVLNVYFGASGGGILGQAEVGGNTVYCLYNTIGNGEPELLASYNLSKTLVHEVGHSLYLWHTFSDNACDRVPVFPDVPETTRPNYATELFQDGNGIWTCRGDHRYNDRLNGTTESCLDEQLNPETEPNEMGINYMDYGVDQVSLMFTQSQATLMRNWLTNGQGPLELKTSQSPSFSESLALSGTGSAVGSSGSSSSSANDDGEVAVGGGGVGGSSSTSSNKLSSGAIIGISVGVGLFVLMVIVWMVFLRKSQATNKHMSANGIQASDLFHGQGTTSTFSV